MEVAPFTTQDRLARLANCNRIRCSRKRCNSRMGRRGIHAHVTTVVAVTEPYCWLQLMYKSWWKLVDSYAS